MGWLGWVRGVALGSGRSVIGGFVGSRRLLSGRGSTGKLLFGSLAAGAGGGGALGGGARGGFGCRLAAHGVRPLPAPPLRGLRSAEASVPRGPSAAPHW